MSSIYHGHEQEHLVDTQIFISSEEENNHEDVLAFDFSQNLYDQALDLAEHEDDPWKELSEEDVTDWQEINEEETAIEYTEEIPDITATPTTPCVIIDNEHGEICRCNRPSDKRLLELVGVWEIDINAVDDVNKKFHLLGVCMNHFNYDQNTVHSKKLKHERSLDKSKVNQRICFFCNTKKIFFSRGSSCIEHTWNIYNQSLQVPCRGMVCCSAISDSSYTEKMQNSRGVRYVCCQCYEKHGGHLHIRPGSGKKDVGCTSKHVDDIETALHHFAKLIETVAQSHDPKVKEHLLCALFPCLENFKLDPSAPQPIALPSLFVVNTAFRVKGIDFPKQMKKLELKSTKCEEFGQLLALEVLKSRTSLIPKKSTLESPNSLQQYYEAMPKCLTSFMDGLVFPLQHQKYEAVKRKQKERKKSIAEFNKTEMVKITAFLSSMVLSIAFRGWKIWLPQAIGSFCERPKLASYLRAILHAANVVAYSKDHEVRSRKKRMVQANPQERLESGPNIWNLAIIDNIDFKEKTFRAGNLFDTTRDTAHATLRMVFQFQMPALEISPLVSDTLQENLCGKSIFTKHWLEKLTQIFTQLITEKRMEFGMDEINAALKDAVRVKSGVPPPNVVILEAGPAPSSNEAADTACDMYMKDLGLSQEDCLDIVCDEAIFRRLTKYSNSQLKLNPILGQWHTSKDMCSVLIIAFSGYGLFGLASVLGTKFLDKFQSVVDYRATFRVLELIWAAVAIVINMYMHEHSVTLEDIENGKNNVLKVWLFYYQWTSWLKLHKIGIRMGNFEVQHECLRAFAPLFPVCGKNRYAESVTHFLMTVETNPELKAKLQAVGSTNLTASEHFFAFDEALETFGVKFIKQNMTGCSTDLENLKLVIKAAQNERDRLMALHAEYVSDNCISKTMHAKNDRKEALWRLVTTLYEAINSDKPERHPLFEISDQLTPGGYGRMLACYEKGKTRIKDIIRQDVLKIEKRIATGRKKRDLEPLLAKDVAQHKKKTERSSSNRRNRLTQRHDN